MTTPTGTITLGDIQTEFGGSNPIQFSEYYAGGAYVPAGTAGLPSTGTLSMNAYRGKSKVTPVTVTVDATTKAEGNFFTVYFASPVITYSTIYWKLTDYSNLQDADFNTVTGVSYYDYEISSYSADVFRPIVDSGYEGTGTFKITAYSDPARTQSIGQSTTLTVTDTYTIGSSSLSRTEIFRYANLNTAYRASVVSLSTSGLEGATVYYEVFPFISAYTLTAADIDAPTSLTGTITVPAGGNIQLTVRATNWDGSNSIRVDKAIFVRFRLNNASGPVLGLSPALILYQMPLPSFSFSPTVIREGYSTALSGNVKYIPLDGSASFYYTISGTAGAADWVGPDGAPGISSGEIIWTSETMNGIVFAAIDSLSESNENMTWTWRVNSTSGSGFWAHSFTIESPAVVIDATATDTTVQINNVSPYPALRTFTVQWRVKPAASAGSVSPYGSYNTAISGSNLLAVSGSMIASPIAYTTNSGNNNGVFDYQIKLSAPGYQDYIITRTSSSQTFPVYGLLFTVTGTNAVNNFRTVYAQITSTPTYPEQRNFVIEYRLKAAGTPTWGEWTGGFSTTVNVAANATSSSNTIIRPLTIATAQFDVQLRCVLAWQEIRESNIINGVWL